MKDVRLESISLFPEDEPLWGSPPLATHLEDQIPRYERFDVRPGEEKLSPRLWNLPENFRRTLKAYSGHHLHEVTLQNRLTDFLRYNFSDGLQISAGQILRHPYQSRVPAELLPDAKRPDVSFDRWPLTPTGSRVFVTQATLEIEEIIQQLLERILRAHRGGALDLFIQHRSRARSGFALRSVEFNPRELMDWRVEIKEDRGALEGEFALVSGRGRLFSFYESFALDPAEGLLVVHPWENEFRLIRERLGQELDSLISRQEMPRLHLRGEARLRDFLDFLRHRPLPVRLEGTEEEIPSHRSLLKIHLNETSEIRLEHAARSERIGDVRRRNWLPSSLRLLEALSDGLPSFLGSAAKDLAARSGRKREWDLRLLKHLGILHFIAFETLHWRFEGRLSDGSMPSDGELFRALAPRVQGLLTSGPGSAMARDLALEELCSKGVLSCLSDFAETILKELDSCESLLSEGGEVFLQGAAEREGRLIFHLLRHLALRTGGDLFRRTRTPLRERLGGSLEALRLPGTDGAPAPLRECLEVLQPLIPFGFQLLYQDRPIEELREDEFLIDLSLRTGDDLRPLDWFELNPRFFLHGQEVDAKDLPTLGGGGVIEHQGRLYLVPRQQMPSLRKLELFWLKIQSGRATSSRGKESSKIYQLPRHQTLELLSLRASGIPIRGDTGWKVLCDFYDNLDVTERTPEVPPSVSADLKPYQRTGVRWLQDLFALRMGALLADEMGLGKTLQTLTFLENLRWNKQLGPTLIVVPSSLVFNWQAEIEKFTPELPVFVFSARDRDKMARQLSDTPGTVVLITYSLLMEHEEFLRQFSWQIGVFDEAQNLKNIGTKRTSAARAMDIQFKICLTGTPMENHYGEFFSIIDLIVPGSLGSMSEFRRRYVQTDVISRDEIADLKLKIRPLLLRRTKREILDQLPDKQETKVSISFEDRQREIYRDVALAYNRRVQESIETQGEAAVQLQMLTALLRLRQVCSDPAALPNVRYDRTPPKLEALAESLREIIEAGESALVFTQFLQTLDHAAKMMKELGLPVFVLHGSIPSRQRQKILADFSQMEGGAVLIMTLKTGGVGLNLTKASYVFHLEPWWNPAVENQATDRAHRMGQTKAVQVFRYIMHDSLEEKIELLKDRKDRRFHFLMTQTEKEIEDGAASTLLSKKDFDFLLGV